MVEQRAQRRLQRAHEQRRREALARHVGDAQQAARLGALAARQRERVVVVAADLLHRPVHRREAEARYLGQRGREEPLLDARRDGQLALHLLLLERLAEQPAVVERHGGLGGHAGAELEVRGGVLEGPGPLAERHEAAHVVADPQDEDDGDTLRLEHVAKARVSDVGHADGVGQIGQRLAQVGHRRQHDAAALPPRLAVSVAAGGDAVAAQQPLPRQGERQHADDLVRLVEPRKRAAQLDERAELLNLLVELAVGARRGGVRARVGDAGGRQPEQRIEEVALVAVNRDQSGWRKHQPSDSRVGADRDLFGKPSRTRQLVVERRAGLPVRQPARHRDAQAVAIVDDDRGTRHQQPSHDGPEEMTEQVVEVERGVEELGGFEERLEARGGSGRHGEESNAGCA